MILLFSVYSKKQSKLIFVGEGSRSILGCLSIGAIFHGVPHRSASKARSPLLVQALLVIGTFSSYVALLAAIEAIGKRILLLLAFIVGMVLRAAFVTETSFCCGALAEQVLP